MRLRYPSLIFVVALASTAQTPKSATGVVTGHVYCADTNAPARMASVQLKSVEEPSGSTSLHDFFSSGSQPDGVVQTAMDGSFILTGVRPGTYYVLVAATGYLSSQQDREDTEKDKSQKQPMPENNSLPDIPKVQVQADQTANIDIRLERGAAVSGTVLYDDGSPAPGANVVALHKDKDKWVQTDQVVSIMTASPTGITDDLGHYRISGLQGQEYILEVMLNRTDFVPLREGPGAMRVSMRSSMQIYSGDTARIRDAVSFKLHSGEERTGEDITIPLSKFHSVSGVVTAARDDHALREAFVQVDDPDSKNTIASAQTSADGTFTIDGVPEGSWVIRVTNAADRQEHTMKVGDHEIISEDTVTHHYGPHQQTIKVEGDLSNLVLSVPEEAQTAPAATSR